MRRTSTNAIRAAGLGLGMAGIFSLSCGVPAAHAAWPWQRATLQADSQGSDVPPGILLTAARIGGGDGFQGGGGRQRGRVVVIFTDTEARPLYFATKDGAAVECSGACLEKWRPALAPAYARPSGNWTLVGERAARQWAFLGKPLYTFINEAPYKDNPNEDRNPGPIRPLRGHGADGIWSVAQADPSQWMKLPASFTVSEFPMAPGQVLATSAGRPLYTFNGTAAQEQSLSADFRPSVASALDLPVGEFGIRQRTDGMRQWEFRGAPLYSCECDLDLGDVNGKDAAAGIAPAVMLRFPEPAEVALKKDTYSGGRMVEAKTGRTLYFRTRDNARLPDNTRAIQRFDPTIGATMGISHCDAECEKTWRPLLAPRNALPQGYWTIYERPDRTRQWAYHNYALYTRANDPPGTLTDNEKWTITFDEGAGAPQPAAYGMGIRWRAVVP